ncbi:hypothetical protein L6164_012304 [Bauhinia variegata]|uniref:Uncharacterized protein n=1 Tax=Bauhinia variegata TaxID=167791 RepID=A0ACB9P9K0_BAUVA|nr:hypothetical protein L6164_012304 [Bauhinia variegata]
MSQPIILSDEEDQNETSTPFTGHHKKRRTEPDPNPTVFVVDDDPTPQKPSSTSTPSFVPETPMSGLLNSDVAIVKCTQVSADSDVHVSRASTSEPKLSGISRIICLESDNESENSGMDKWNENERSLYFDLDGDSGWTSKPSGSRSSTEAHIASANASLTEMSGDNHSNPTSSQLDNHPVYDHLERENIIMEQVENTEKMKRSKVNEKKNNTSRAMGRTKMTKEERMRMMEEKKIQKEQEKLKKAALKAEVAELKKIEREKQKWEKGKFALKSIVAEIDAKVVESGSIGGHLLTRFAEKGLNYHITSNPIERSILWFMKVPEDISQLSTERIEIPYVLLVYEADECCNLVTNDSLLDLFSSIQSRYPNYKVCYLTNRLMAYINRREQEKYKNPENNSCWRRPPVEEVLAKLTIHFSGVHSRQCVDEAEVAEHVVGLTCSLASCHFRKKLTRLSVNANGSVIPKDSIDRNLIKKSLWLKALVAIPMVQPRFAIAIWKKYPTMKSLLSAYMDPNKSDHEKEFLLKDLMTEGLLGGDRRLGEVCSKRVYRILMAQRGSIRTDDVEDGADFFGSQSS